MANSLSSNAKPLFTRVAFVEARFSDPASTNNKLIARFNSFSSTLRQAKVGPRHDASNRLGGGSVLTSNYAHWPPPPLRSRCTKVQMRDLTVNELKSFVLRERRRRGLSGQATSGIIGALEQAGGLKIAPSLRTTIRMIERAELQDARPVVH